MVGWDRVVPGVARVEAWGPEGGTCGRVGSCGPNGGTCGRLGSWVLGVALVLWFVGWDRGFPGVAFVVRRVGSRGWHLYVGWDRGVPRVSRVVGRDCGVPGMAFVVRRLGSWGPEGVTC